jgi:hypothetical protein
MTFYKKREAKVRLLLRRVVPMKTERSAQDFIPHQTLANLLSGRWVTKLVGDSKTLNQLY